MNFDGNKDSSTYYVGKDQTFDELLEVKEEIFAQLDSHWDGSDEEESIALEQSPKMKQRLVDALATPLTHCFSALE